MKQTSPAINELIRLMAALEALYQELAALMERKLNAMRKADAPGLADLGAREAALIQRLRDQDEQRRRALEQVGKALDLTPARARTLSVSLLCARLDEPQRVRLLQAGKSLRNAVFRAAKLNRLATAVARDVLEHMRWVFASVRRHGDGAPGGRMEHRILDAVG